MIILAESLTKTKNMNLQNETTQYGRKINYPVLKKLPSGTHLVKQDGACKGHISKYASFTPSGKIIMISAGDSIREARKATLAELNKKLREVSLIYDNPSPKQFHELVS